MILKAAIFPNKNNEGDGCDYACIKTITDARAGMKTLYPKAASPASHTLKSMNFFCAQRITYPSPDARNASHPLKPSNRFVKISGAVPWAA